MLLILFACLGEAVLGFIGISMPAFRIAGGILLFLTALDMLFERRTKRREDNRRGRGRRWRRPVGLSAGHPADRRARAIATMILLAGPDPAALGLLLVHRVMLAVLRRASCSSCPPACWNARLGKPASTW